MAAYATDAPPAQQQQQQPTSAKSNRAYQNEVDYYSAEAEAAVAKSSSKATPKPAAAAESTAATGVESAAPAVPIAADQALQANREDSEKKSDAEVSSRVGTSGGGREHEDLHGALACTAQVGGGHQNGARPQIQRQCSTSLVLSA